MYAEDEADILSHPDLQMMKQPESAREEHTSSSRDVYRDDDEKSEDDDPCNAEGANIRDDVPDPARIAQPFVRKAGNTGPKGVIADQKDYARRQKYMAESRKLESMDALRRQAGELPPISQPTPAIQTNLLDSESEPSDEDDDEFMKQYRKKRLQALLKTTGPRFGRVVQMSRAEYVTEVDEVPATTFVLVHLTVEYLPQSQRMSRCLVDFAREYPSIKVCEIDAHEAKPGYADEALPTIIAYRNTEVFTTLVGICQDIGHAFEVPDVIALLEKARVIAE